MLDIDALATLREIMEDEFSPLIELYIRDSDQRFPAMREALRENDAEGVRLLVHSLKGASSNVCAADLAEHAHCVEQMAIDGKVDQLATAVDALESDYLQVRQSLHSYITSA
ncbi:Hpt domain-containing protein [Thalassolituus maritimus]|uniref:HPt domain-containing protein n=1 Tax=Thalassolituus maritimus TaxID=484498 RepID=A0ABQ0A2C2_9GAMM